MLAILESIHYETIVEKMQFQTTYQQVYPNQPKARFVVFKTWQWLSAVS
jgi:hypothetical protein